MSSSNSAPVYTGFWINHAYGTVHGTTLTLTSVHGTYLIAFLALFVQVLGSIFWSLLAYAVFLIRSRRRADGLHYQQQAIFRNGSSDLKAFTQFLMAGWAWRKVSGIKRPLSRSFAYALLALANITVFLVCGIFSSRITRATPEVLLKPTLCGDYEIEGPFDYQKNSTALSAEGYTEVYYNYQNYMSGLAEPSALYATSCTGVNDTTGYCTPITRRAMEYTKSVSLNCPFDRKICSHNTISLNTGMLDSLLDFGINTQFEDRVGIEYAVECAPLKRNGFATPWLPYNNSEVQWSAKKYGYNVYPGSVSNFFYYGRDATTLSNFTMVIWLSDLELAVNNAETTITGTSNYNVPSVYNRFNDYENSNFLPIPALNATNADVTLMWVLNQGFYKEPVDDPWFSAHQPVVMGGWAPDVKTQAYARDLPVALGCTERSKICSVPTGHCTAFSGGTHDLSGILTERQRRLAMRLGQRQSLYFTITALSQFGMVADQSCHGALCAKLPDDQWMLEIERAFGTSLVIGQSRSIDFINGPTSPQIQKYWAPPLEKDQWMCDSQIAIRSDYSSFSGLGLALILGFGGLILLTKLTIELLSNIVQPEPTGAGREWQMTSFFQLQRMAFEGRHEGAWVELDDHIPVTETAESLPRFHAATVEDVKGGIETNDKLMASHDRL